MYIENAYITIGYWFPGINCDGFSFPFNLFHNARKRKTEVLKVYDKRHTDKYLDLLKSMNRKMMFHLLGKQKISGKWLTSMKFDTIMMIYVN